MGSDLPPKKEPSYNVSLEGQQRGNKWSEGTSLRNRSSRWNVTSLHDRIGDIMAEKEQSKIAAHIQPNASQNEVVGFKDGVLRVRIAAPPVKGKANQELIKFLSNVLGVSKSNLTIEKGITGKKKTVAIRGLGQEQVARLLERH